MLISRGIPTKDSRQVWYIEFKDCCERAYMNRIPYANIVGSLMYVMVCTKPDIAYAVSLVSRYMENPGKAHWQALKWILRFINGSLNRVLIYSGALGEDNTAVIEGYVDSDYAG